MRRRRRLALVAWVLLAFCAATLRLFVVPSVDRPAPVDAVVVLGGQGDRLRTGLDLVRRGYAPTLVVSVPGQGCPAPVDGVRVECFAPDPYTTQGEARYAAGLIRQAGWRHIIVVSTTDQRTRAGVRFARCTGIGVRYVTVRPPPRTWPYVIAYEWAALVKALVVQRGC